MKKLSLVLIGLCVSVTVTGCISTKQTPAAEKILVLAVERVRNCTELAKIHVTTSTNVAGVVRREDWVAEELTNIAKNKAAQKGGDTVAALSPAENGEQTFGIYRCL